jgi:hypothetical protein
LRTFDKLDYFLRETLSGFDYLTFIEKGSAEKVLLNPERYSLDHIAGNINAWGDEEVIVIEFNDIGIHFCFTPIEKAERGLRYQNNEWQ